MPLPSYMLENPKTNPIQVIENMIGRLGANAAINRQGKTITVKNLDCEDGSHETTKKAIKIICTQADMIGVSVDAIVPDILGNTVSDFEHFGFQATHNCDETHPNGPSTLLRRTVGG